MEKHPGSDLWNQLKAPIASFWAGSNFGLGRNYPLLRVSMAIIFSFAMATMLNPGTPSQTSAPTKSPRL